MRTERITDDTANLFLEQHKYDDVLPYLRKIYPNFVKCVWDVKLGEYVVILKDGNENGDTD